MYLFWPESLSARGLSKSHQSLQKLALAALALAVMSMTGCGGSGSGSSPSQGNSNVTILLSATGNNELAAYSLNFLSLTLTGKSGNTATVFTSGSSTVGTYGAEFTHLNSSLETLLTASIPDDTYTSATLTVGGAGLSCVSLDPQTQGLAISDYAYGATPSSQVTVTLPSPIAVSGTSVNLRMQLDLSKSYSLGECYDSSPTNTYAFTPTFTLTTADLTSQPTDYTNGRETDVLNLVNAVTANGFTIGSSVQSSSQTAPNSQNISVNTSTAFQGVSGLSALSAGMLVDMDLAAQTDGSLLATRVAVEDPNAAASVAGPVLYLSDSSPVLESFVTQREGSGPSPDTQLLDTSKASFHISGGFTNLNSLPFTPSVTATNLVPGQNIYATWQAASSTGGFENAPFASTITLMPQALDGVVTSTGSSGNFTTYTITLASYDLLPDLAVQTGTASLIPHPGQVVVYADSSASLAGVTEPAIGSTYLFHGLVFNDGGTLRMDCDQIAAGVAQ